MQYKLPHHCQGLFQSLQIYYNSISLKSTSSCSSLNSANFGSQNSTKGSFKQGSGKGTNSWGSSSFSAVDCQSGFMGNTLWGRSPKGQLRVPASRIFMQLQSQWGTQGGFTFSVNGGGQVQDAFWQLDLLLLMFFMLLNFLFDWNIQLNIITSKKGKISAHRHRKIIGIRNDNRTSRIKFNQGARYYYRMKIAIAGGGICGLTLALAAKTAGMTPIVIQQRPDMQVQSFGGGIGLWPPSQMVYQRLGILDKLQSVSGTMPSASYFNHKGQKLGEPSRHFSERYRILCLERAKLTAILQEQCEAQGIEIKTGVGVSNAQSSQTSVKVQLSSGQFIVAKALIGADGINSQVRNIIMRQRKKPPINPSHCGYAYFRAVLDLSKISGYDPSNSNFHDYAFQSWGQEKRFGYVPLKEPQIFWFVAIPINKYGLSEYYGSHVCSDEQKKWILSLFQHWKAPVSIKKLIELTPAQTILRTDIRKIKGVTEFPWNSKHNNMLIVGDAANATAPNLAQGAGLAIESAWDLIAMVNFKNGQGVDKFMEKRRKRAKTVQDMADLVAKVGQLNRPYSDVRDLLMYTSTKYLHSFEERIFQATVNYSLGGSSDSLHWLASRNPGQGFISNQTAADCLLSSIIGPTDFKKLPEKTQRFRSQLIGEGDADVSVKAGFGSQLLGLSDSIQGKKFGAYVDTYFNPKTNSIEQKWTRIFNEGQKGAKLYSTVFRGTPYFGAEKSGLIMTQSLGTDIIRKWIRFGYEIKVLDAAIHYKSIGLWLCNYRLPIPRMLLPTSEWTEQQTAEGWKFDGVIKYPKLMGAPTLLHYSGHFNPKLNAQYTNKKIVIAGGSGFIGKTVTRIFHQKGWHVTILSRSSESIYELPFAKVQKWNPNPSMENIEEEVSSLMEILKGKDAVINLAGESPAGGRWTQQKKEKIVQSRLMSIDLIAAAINKLDSQGIIFVQSSAVGIYGSRRDEILLEDSPLETSKDTFRIKCVKALEELTREKSPNAVLLRIGHVLGSEGGMFPFLKLFSALRGKKYGAGGQYIPWVHVEDVAQAMFHIINKQGSYRGKIVNMASPEHHTYDSLYRAMGQIHNRTPIFRVPEWVFKLLLGQLSSVLLQSQRMHPQLLLDNGFEFQYGELKKALASRALL